LSRRGTTTDGDRHGNIPNEPTETDSHIQLYQIAILKAALRADSMHNTLVNGYATVGREIAVTEEGAYSTLGFD